jgi:hypothetical protein
MVNNANLILKAPIPFIGVIGGFAAVTADYAVYFFENIRIRM